MNATNPAAPPVRRVFKKRAAPKAKGKQSEPQQSSAATSGIVVRVPLTQRHFEWLQRVAAKEGRTTENMLERIVRVAYSQDPTKGGVYSTGRLGEGGQGAGNGVAGQHPATGRGGE